MADLEGKTKRKRLSKSERTHIRRLKQGARKPGGAVAIQLATRARQLAEAPTKEKASSPTPGPDSPPTSTPNEHASS